MNRGLLFLMVIAFFAIIYLILRSISGKRWKRYCAEIMESDDVVFLLRHLSSEFPEEVRKTAGARLLLLSQKTNNPDLLLKINDHVKLDKEEWEIIAERLSPEDLLLKIAPKLEVDASILENALGNISNIDTLADIAANINIPTSIRKQALPRITDNDILFPILFRYYPDLDAAEILDEEQLTEYGMYQCRNGRHDFDNELISLDEEAVRKLDKRLQIADRYNKCRRCGKLRGLSWNEEDHGWDYIY